MLLKSKKKIQKFESLRFLHLSDLHFPDIKFQDPNLVSIDKKDGYKSAHTSILDELYNLLDTVNFILISGDLTTNSNLEGFDKCLSFIKRKFSHHNIEIYSVFGNHDLKRRLGEKKFDEFMKKTKEYSCVDFIGCEICEHRELTIHDSNKVDFNLILINSCKNSSDKPLVPERLEKCVTESLYNAFHEEEIYNDEIIEEKVTEIWNKIKVEIENSTLIDDIYFQNSDYITLRNKLESLGSIICLSHYNLLSFNGVDKLSSFFSDQGKVRDIFVKHKNTVIYLCGHTHTQECTVIENPEDHTKKLICVSSPPLFQIESSNENGFNIVDVIFRKNDDNIYKPIGCKISKFKGNFGSNAECQRIRFSSNITEVEFTDNERTVIATLRKLSRESRDVNRNVRVKDLLESLKQLDTEEAKKFDINDLHEILMYLWWIGVINEYSAMKRENEYEAKQADYAGGVLCLPMNH